MGIRAYKLCALRALRFLEEPDAGEYAVRVMENTLLDRKEGLRKSGTLTLYVLAADPAAGPSEPYGRFRVTRGFIDDLNRVLPIRLRIQLEGDIARGGLTGSFQAGTVRYRWEFQAQ